eukprot:1194523-Prorocentrum_minimum.AAC.1
MATMLGVLTCDAAVDPYVWRHIVRTASIKSFNQITVDGDVSTNDCVIGLASGAAGNPVISGAIQGLGNRILRNQFTHQRVENLDLPYNNPSKRVVGSPPLRGPPPKAGGRYPPPSPPGGLEEGDNNKLRVSKSFYN